MPDHPTRTGESGTFCPRTPLVDGIIALVLCLVLGTFFVEALKLPPSFNPSDVGPGRFPLVASAAGLLLSLIHLFRSGRAFVASLEPQDRVTFKRPLAVLATAAVLLAQLWLFPLAGPYVSSITTVAALILLGGERRWWVVVVPAVGFALF
ncbi:MAG: tripartite tricarboxylate transporter TctB family protein, partial [Rhodospirillum sp.]|nr:tripartite tricarboxylate transporter TctB family protein [Rhodospirillum sp.]